MNAPWICGHCVLLLTTWFAAAAEPKAADHNWPRFRGPNGAATSADKDVPLEWSATKNIVWKAPLPGRGASSPIVWEDRVYVAAYTGYGLTKNDAWDNRHNLRRHLLCFDRRNGNLLWKADHDGPMKDHGVGDFLALHGYASSTPVADADAVYVYFGNAGVFAYGHDGQRKWHKELGSGIHSWGSASSPILFENLLIVHADIESQALIAFDKATGSEKWRFKTDHTKFGDSWSTPLVVNTSTGPELVFHWTAGTPATLGALDPRTGELLWKCGVLKDYLCPSPIVHDGIIYAIAHQKAAAVRPGGRGEVSASHVKWTMNKGSEICTPVLHDGHLYWTSEEGTGIAYCVNAATGNLVYQERLQPAAGKIYASGVLVNGKIYYPSREKGTYVVAAKPKFELLAHNVIEGDNSIFNGTPAISRGQLFLRSDKFLYCIGK